VAGQSYGVECACSTEARLLPSPAFPDMSLASLVPYGTFPVKTVLESLAQPPSCRLPLEAFHEPAFSRHTTSVLLTKSGEASSSQVRNISIPVGLLKDVPSDTDIMWSIESASSPGTRTIEECTGGSVVGEKDGTFCTVHAGGSLSVFMDGQLGWPLRIIKQNGTATTAAARDSRTIVQIPILLDSANVGETTRPAYVTSFAVRVSAGSITYYRTVLDVHITVQAAVVALQSTFEAPLPPPPPLAAADCTCASVSTCLSPREGS